MANTDINNTWQPYLKAGGVNEAEFKALLKNIFPDIKKMEGNFKEYDFIIPSRDLKLELKMDFKSDDTGNLAFEYECFGCKSGLALTTADYYVMTDKHNFYFFKTDELKSFIRLNWKYLIKKVGGDNNASKMILIRKTDISRMKHFYSFKKAGGDINLLRFYFSEWD